MTGATIVTESTPNADAGAFLTSLRLADSFLPVGAYTASYGIEQFLETGRIDNADDLRAVLEDYLHAIVGPAEIIALANTHRAAAAGDVDQVVEIDRRLHSMTLPAEFRKSSEKAGDQILSLFSDEVSTVSTYAAAVEDGRTPGNYVVALAVVGQREGMSVEQACLVHAYSFVTDLLGAAQRLGRLSHVEIQQVLDGLQPEIETVCDRWSSRSLDEMWSFAPTVETMSMTHERADRRLFMS